MWSLVTIRLTEPAQSSSENNTAEKTQGMVAWILMESEGGREIKARLVAGREQLPTRELARTPSCISTPVIPGRTCKVEL